jgi:hypothetical protein
MLITLWWIWSAALVLHEFIDFRNCVGVDIGCGIAAGDDVQWLGIGSGEREMKVLDSLLIIISMLRLLREVKDEFNLNGVEKVSR